MIVNEITYHDETPKAVIDILERVRADRTRIRIHYGDVRTGRDWLDTCGVAGRACSRTIV